MVSRFYSLLARGGPVALVAALALPACATRDTSTVAPDPPEPQPLVGEATPLEQQPLVDAAQLEANDEDLERLEQINASIESLSQEYLQSVDALQKAVDTLAASAKEHKIPEKRLDKMITAALGKGDVKLDARIPKDAREDFQTQLDAVKTLAPAVFDPPTTIAERKQQIEQLHAEAQQRHSDLQGRSNAVAATPTQEVHPELRSDLEQGSRLADEIDAKAQASDATFGEATRRAEQLADALGVE